MQHVLPRWRGFNLLEMFTLGGFSRTRGRFQEDDFRWISDWGFDFVRLPLCFRLWIKDDDPMKIDDSRLELVDRAVDLGRKYNLHVCLNFHRAPGFSVNSEYEEPYNLWKDQDALDAFCFHWQTFAVRYRGISADRLSFNLVNEPRNFGPLMSREDHRRVISAAVGAIRSADPQRLIIADGTRWGNDPSPDLAGLGIAQSCRAYAPMTVSHYKAHWVQAQNWPEPKWPGRDAEGRHWRREVLAEHYAAWAALADRGIGVHCGEGGAYNHTPHDVFLRWFRDVLEILKHHNIGWALWNFRGAFGVLDSKRSDVDYEDWHGHALDRELLKLLQEF